MSNWTENELGFELKTPRLHVFFGKKAAHLEALKEAYPNYNLRRLKQVHGPDLIQAQEDILEADAHWSSNTHEALCINTADCTPIFLHSEEKGLIAAIHAGWRGVANQLISKTVLSLAYQGVQFKEMQVYAGPHIGFDSFEVETEVKKQLLGAIPHMNDKDMRKAEVYKDLNETKTLINLSKIIDAQLINFSIPADNIHWLRKDTMTDNAFHSHRRDKEQSGRQLSFICQL